ncbi:OmpA family protein [Salipiger sp. 1_MG-2023]|uniref:OmpA family protein n=1 Tax=Salipiger sp. 1_MG-2023 TaxID=3062665 RepID=UPI0026E3B92A|nr:OmpA family protein [Salipiger sp. 1_MG-2023]MDO6587960.1 OmpA family protein [Salipiger sp. 1_MG-2023]
MIFSKTTVFAAFFAVMALLPPPVVAQQIDPFENGWTLDAEASQLRFMSIKKDTIAETSEFATISGLINADGKAQIRVLMDSVDTNIDLRNVRMRFLFFETFKFPEATITVTLEPDALRDLHAVRRKMVPVDYLVALHGAKFASSAEVAVTLISNDRVNVSTTNPIALTLTDFNLEEGRQKLMEAAQVDIVPVGLVSFDFVFDRASPGTPPPQLATAPAGASAALETSGAFDREACLGRFEILSKAGNINFNAGSARLTADSNALLDNLYDIVSRCPDLMLEIGGHTDADGSDATNMALSERRAGAVAAWLRNKGIPAARMTVVGYGESRPLRPNDSAENKARNRRIEFTALN